MSASLSRNTSRAYGSAWRAFQQFCAEAARDSLPARTSTVIDFVLWCIDQNYRLQTVYSRVSAISHHHRNAGLTSPVDQSVHELLSFAKRDRKEKRGGKQPLTPSQLRSILIKFSTVDPIEVRNRAMLTLLFASGWRRSELVPLDLADVQFVRKGLTLWQAFSKTDQEGKGRLVAIHYGENVNTCPVRALRAWIEMRGNWNGPLFVQFTPRGTITEKRFHRGGEIAYRIVKDSLTRIGANPKDYGAHSTRSGMITASAENGADPIAIMQRTGQRNIQSVMRYIRPVQAFQRDPLAGVL